MAEKTSFGRTAETLLSALRAGAPGTEVSLGPPREDLTETAIDVHLLGARGAPPAHHPDLWQQPVVLEFVVAVAGPPDVAADRYHDAWVAVQDTGSFAIEADGVPVALWTALGTRPRPALRVSARVVLERTIPRARTVTEVDVSVRHKPRDTDLAERS